MAAVTKDRPGAVRDDGPRRTAGPRTRPPRTPKWPRAATPWLYLAPVLVLFGVFKFWPTVWGMYLSFFQVRPYLGNKWVGWANFSTALHDPLLRSAVEHTVVDALATVAASAVIGFGLALLLEGPARHLRILRTAAFLPVVTAMVAVAELWNTILYPGAYGTLNTLLGHLGLGPEPFLSSPHSSLASVMLIQVWKSAPYDMVIFVAGLAGIDKQLYEAAAIDGAGAWHRLRHVTLPSLRPVTTIVLTLGVIRGLRVFTEIYVLTGGGPAASTETVVTYTYKQGIQNSQLGLASAVSTVLFLATVLLTCLTLWWRRRKEA
ncbi:carbohydrate ABC transporter membrane protein 1, CUT1 family [Streptomyces sp. DvalAA-14]|uniref:carbohydrate ABC transporter permease n=1 Tax=unclassified Streptomyces TaxID=2593676 RepID=UPI00081B908F|nr:MULTISPECIES: sugar ABC transporter permease [unclassified Streptomyces]MYS21372.1 ABC transporter permease subunit [Streptomyces sp. SID4948]SCD90909.1 carbohydrate ABC transporter membrane protein 1, CUT1 family [Streptomyces sp. DvalAA-14]